MKNEIVNTWTKIAIDEIHEDGRDVSIKNNIRLSILGALDEYEKSLEPKHIPDLFHPGEFVKEEMKARDWNLHILCIKLQMQPRDVQNILREDFTIGTHEAQALAKAFGSSAQEWLNLQATYNAGIAIEKMKAAEELAEYVLWYHKENMKDNPDSARMTFIWIEILKLARKIKPEEKDG